MFIINLTYKKPSDVVEPLREGHMAFVKEQFANGNFLVSGRKPTADGGVILCSVPARAELDEILATDPFVQHDVVDLEIIEFAPTTTCPQLEYLKGK